MVGQIKGRVPLIMNGSGGLPLNAPAGKKVLDYDKTTDTSVYYEALGAYLKDKQKTTGTLWKDPNSDSVPVQIARIGLYLHMLQDTSSHATYCGDDGPSPPGGGNPVQPMLKPQLRRLLRNAQTSIYQSSLGKRQT